MTVPRLLGSFAPGTGEAAPNPLLVLLPSLGTTTALWDGVVAALRADRRTAGLRILTIDLPGHGASPASTEPFSIDELAEAVLAVVDEAGGGSFHAAGVSLGGVIALELAVSHPGRVRSLVLSCSSAKIGTPDGWAERAASVRAGGTASLVTGAASRWFARGFLDRDAGGPGARTLTAARRRRRRVVRLLRGCPRRIRPPRRPGRARCPDPRDQRRARRRDHARRDAGPRRRHPRRPAHRPRRCVAPRGPRGTGRRRRAHRRARRASRTHRRGIRRP